MAMRTPPGSGPGRLRLVIHDPHDLFIGDLGEISVMRTDRDEGIGFREADHIINLLRKQCQRVGRRDGHGKDQPVGRLAPDSP